MILSAQFANEDRTAVVIVTEERGAVVISEKDRPDLWTEYREWKGTTAPMTPIDLDALDQEALNRALAAEGSVLRALAELVLIEVNKLRADHGRAAYTKQQFVSALKQVMRSGA